VNKNTTVPAVSAEIADEIRAIFAEAELCGPMQKWECEARARSVWRSAGNIDLQSWQLRALVG
jgi:hypothetical protein